MALRRYVKLSKSMFAQVHWPVNVLGGYELVLRDSSLEGFGDIIVLELCC